MQGSVRDQSCLPLKPGTVCLCFLRHIMASKCQQKKHRKDGASWETEYFNKHVSALIAGRFSVRKRVVLTSDLTSACNSTQLTGSTGQIYWIYPIWQSLSLWLEINHELNRHSFGYQGWKVQIKSYNVVWWVLWDPCWVAQEIHLGEHDLPAY